METKSFYEVPAVRVVDVKTGCIICGSDPQASQAMRSGYGTAEEI